MKITNGQAADLETIMYFIPEQYGGIEISAQDKADFLLYSDRGVVPPHRANEFRRGKDVFLAVTGGHPTGYQCLLMGKASRRMHMDMWEEGIMNGDVPLYCLFALSPAPPDSVVKYASRTLFKGSLKGMIEELCNTRR